MILPHDPSVWPRYVNSQRYEEQNYGDKYDSTKQNTTINPCNPMNCTKCNKGEHIKKILITAGMYPLPKPWGNRCPQNLWNYIKDLKLGDQRVAGNDTANWLCISDFPNLPFYGNLTTVPESNNNPGIKVGECK